MRVTDAKISKRGNLEQIGVHNFVIFLSDVVSIFVKVKKQTLILPTVLFVFIIYA